MSLSYAHILRRPLVTERSTQLKKLNKFVFEVAPEATKGQIREVAEGAFNVDVVGVNTMRVPGKLRRRGQRTGYQSEWKKAVVTLKKGQDIKYAEPQG